MFVPADRVLDSGAMRRIALLLSALLCVGVLGWATLAWVPSTGAIFGWNAASGTLRVPGEGLAVLPRWSFGRRPGGTIEVRLAGASREGVRVDVRLRLAPAQGTWSLAAGATPGDGLARALDSEVRRTTALAPLGCLTGVASTVEGCAAAKVAVAAAAAGLVGINPDQVEVDLSPDAEAARRYLLQSMGARLPTSGRSVVVIGLDAVDWDLVLPFVERGLMPNLKRLMNAGTWGEMKTIVPMLSPLIWTTMATGVGPDEHGILDFVERDPESGMMLPVTGRQRRFPAIWNLASALGRRTDVVAWWATWPAERINGTMVSDRLYYTLTQGISAEALRADPPDMVFPAEATARFAELRDRAVRETDWNAVRFFIDVPEAAYDEAVAGGRGWDDPIDGMRRMVAATRTYFASALLLAEPAPDLLMLYIEGTDEIGHVMAPYMPPPLVDVDPAMAAVYAASVPRYFQVVDRWIGRMIQAFPLEQRTYVLLSDHGFKWGDDRPRGLSGTAGATAPLWHDPHAMFLLAGSGIEKRGKVSEQASVYDVAPTLAALLGIPPDQRWRGAPLPGAPTNSLAAVDWLPLVPPSSYQSTSGAAAPVDPEYIAKLQSLGYLSSSGQSAGEQTAATALQDAAPTPPPARPTVAEAPSVTRGRLNNLAVIKINEKKYDEAERLLREAIALSPDYASPHYNLRRMYVELGRYDEADRELWAAVDKGLRDPERSVDRAAADYEGLGMEERAESLLSEAVRRFPDHEPIWVHLMVARIRLQRCPAAVEVGRTAARRFPNSAPVHAFLGIAAACAGDAATARPALERSLELKPDQPRLREVLAGLPNGTP